jgi:hypothetical protein
MSGCVSATRVSRGLMALSEFLTLASSVSIYEPVGTQENMRMKFIKLYACTQ